MCDTLLGLSSFWITHGQTTSLQEADGPVAKNQGPSVGDKYTWVRILAPFLTGHRLLGKLFIFAAFQIPHL